MDQQKADKIFQRHKNNSTISAEDHIRNLRIALGQSLEGKTKIYLDKRFWIFIRDVELNRSQSKSHAELLFGLKELVDLGNTICPISETMFLELLKQTDNRTQRATAQMIDAILLDKKRILPCAVYLDGEYGIKGAVVGVPVKLGKNGVEQIIELKLNAEESAALKKSAEAVQELVKIMKLE